MINECLNLDEGQICPGQSVSHYNGSTWRLDPVAYADNDSNPYFFGSPAYNAAYPGAAAANAALQQQPAAVGGQQAAAAGHTSELDLSLAAAGGSPDWTTILLIGLAVVVVVSLAK